MAEDQPYRGFTPYWRRLRTLVDPPACRLSTLSAWQAVQGKNS